MKKHVLILILALIFTACNNKSEDPVPPKAATLSRLIGRWQVESFVENGKNITKEFSKDDVWEFDDKGLLTLRFNKACLNGACSGGTDNNTDSAPYTVSEDGQSFVIAFSSNPSANPTRTILELTATTFKFRFQEGAAQTVYEYTYRKVN